ncbi:hypothetical protein ASE45_05195 [Lysobacter sp. Root96]|nr:hypothetical protein ASE45_05195 [Lysobacter sp. Root96]
MKVTLVPTAGVAFDTPLVIARSACAAIVVLAELLLLAGVGSVVPAGAATVAVLVIAPGVVAVPVTVIVTKLVSALVVAPVSTGRFAVRPMLLPVPLGALQVEPAPVPAQVQLTAVRLAGTVSAMLAPATALGPLFQTRIV